MRTATLAAALMAILFGIVMAQADTYPSRPITLLVGFPPGGPTDTLARIVAAGLKPTLGQPIVVEDLAGAGGTLATARVVHANPDGYTIGIGNWTSHVGAPAIFNVSYDIVNDLQPIALLAAAPLWIVGKNELPPRTAPELIAWLKSNANPSTFATVGAGSAAHLCGLYFAQKVGARLQYVPYRGAGPIIQDLMAGHIDLSCLDTSSTLADVQAGKFKAFALMTEKHWPKSPDTPTMAESGVPGLTIAFWHGLWAPKGTPKDVVDRLDGAVRAALAATAVRQRLEAIGQVIATPEQQTPAGLAAFHKAEIDKWWPIIKGAGIKAD
ncbi:MAG TPA: tripartite tricarboxylate transporter substrate-binding protein [Xanthobacteraceae bacterium]|jgi:tripartite-type tricarboxylate transporter receptor subunit TctC